MSKIRLLVCILRGLDGNRKHPLCCGREREGIRKWITPEERCARGNGQSEVSTKMNEGPNIPLTFRQAVRYVSDLRCPFLGLCAYGLE
jgi:hypothetical protein